MCKCNRRRTGDERRQFIIHTENPSVYWCCIIIIKNNCRHYYNTTYNNYHLACVRARSSVCTSSAAWIGGTFSCSFARIIFLYLRNRKTILSVGAYESAISSEHCFLHNSFFLCTTGKLNCSDCFAGWKIIFQFDGTITVHESRNWIYISIVNPMPIDFGVVCGVRRMLALELWNAWWLAKSKKSSHSDEPKE